MARSALDSGCGTLAASADGPGGALHGVRATCSRRSEAPDSEPWSFHVEAFRREIEQLRDGLGTGGRAAQPHAPHGRSRIVAGLMLDAAALARGVAGRGLVARGPWIMRGLSGIGLGVAGQRPRREVPETLARVLERLNQARVPQEAKARREGRAPWAISLHRPRAASRRRVLCAGGGRGRARAESVAALLADAGSAHREVVGSHDLMFHFRAGGLRRRPPQRPHALLAGPLPAVAHFRRQIPGPRGRASYYGRRGAG